ncbi:hypothetical protein [Bifidobacterium phasiani]|uniref:DUF4129 domain-containing protein n=1 Tax=Bifidobacterium phasiani TaxID=2834431 RepID=A0ABS6W7B1_9BIFI|nr:hypothetical protein [Bifidobacterium phasiani]MBW3082390.1 hypothetical protein [Bifidobacterium phasiani]
MTTTIPWTPQAGAASALDSSDLTTVGRSDLTTPLLIVLAVCLLLAVAAIVAAALLSRPRRSPRTARPRGAHRDGSDRGAWRARVDEVVARYHDGALDREEAFARLAAVARDYASSASGRDMSAHTLDDLRHVPRDPGNRRGLDLLRQTIAALYPAEFADAGANAQARETSVEQAAEWVSALMERWR